MVNHPNRSKHVDRIRVTLSHEGEMLDEMIVRGRRDQTPSDLCVLVCEAAEALLAEAGSMLPGDTLTVTEIS